MASATTSTSTDDSFLVSNIPNGSLKAQQDMIDTLSEQITASKLAIDTKLPLEIATLIAQLIYQFQFTFITDKDKIGKCVSFFDDNPSLMSFEKDSPYGTTNDMQKATAMMKPILTNDFDCEYIIDINILKQDGYTIYTGLCNNLTDIPLNTYLDYRKDCYLYDNSGILMKNGPNESVETYTKGDTIRWKFNPYRKKVTIWKNNQIVIENSSVAEDKNKPGQWYWLCCAHRGTMFEVITIYDQPKKSK